MENYYKKIKVDDVVFAASPAVASIGNRFQEAYKATCQVLNVNPAKQVGRSSFRSNALRQEASEITTFWIEEDNQCKILLQIIL